MLAWVLLLAAAAPAELPAAGLYRTHQMEMAGSLRLAPDGRFQYQLDYGAVSETAEGRWTDDGETVRLTSEPMPRLPRFVLVRDDPAPAGEIYVELAPDVRGWPQPLEVEVLFKGDSSPVVFKAGDRGRVDIGGREPSSVRPHLPIYEADPERPTLGAGGHRLLFRFEPNDFGRAAFRAEPLRREGATLTLTRYQTSIRFEREEPGNVISHSSRSLLERGGGESASGG